MFLCSNMPGTTPHLISKECSPSTVITAHSKYPSHTKSPGARYGYAVVREL